MPHTFSILINMEEAFLNYFIESFCDECSSIIVRYKVFTTAFSIVEYGVHGHRFCSSGSMWENIWVQILPVVYTFLQYYEISSSMIHFLLLVWIGTYFSHRKCHSLLNVATTEWAWIIQYFSPKMPFQTNLHLLHK